MPVHTFIIKSIYYIVYVFGISFSFFLVVGLFLDLRGLDKSGDALMQTKTSEVRPSSFIVPAKDGVVRRGIMSDYYIDCSVGTISFRVHGGVRFDYSLLPEPSFYKEILAVYTPREACRAGGITPEF